MVQNNYTMKKNKSILTRICFYVLVFGLIIVSGATLFPQKADAILYYDQSDDSGVFSGTSGFIGSFTLTESVTFYPTATMRATYKNLSGFCTGSAFGDFAISSSNVTNDGLFSFSAFPNDGSGNYQTGINTLAGATTTLNAGTYYVWFAENCNNVSGWEFLMDSGNTNFFGYISNDGDDTPITPCPIGDDTQFCIFYPHENEVVATSSVPVGARVWVADDDFREGETLKIACGLTHPVGAISPTGGSALDAWNAVANIQTFSIEIPYSGLATTTTTLRDFPDIGQTTCRYEIHKPYILLGFLSSTIDTGFSHFVVATSSIGDLQYSNVITGFNNAVGSSTLNCFDSITGFFGTLVNCIGALVVPDGNLLYTDVQETADAAFHVIPIGYYARVVDILSATSSTTTLPDIVLRLPSSSPLSGTTTLFSMDSVFTNASTILEDDLVNPDNGKSIWDTIMPILDPILYLLFLLVFITHAMKLEMGDKTKKS